MNKFKAGDIVRYLDTTNKRGYMGFKGNEIGTVSSEKHWSNKDWLVVIINNTEQRVGIHKDDKDWIIHKPRWKELLSQK